MNKYELYNTLVDITKSHGQGIPSFVEIKIGSTIVDELVKEGLVKRVRIPYSYLPDDIFICLTKGYCVEEDMAKKDTISLMFVRYYLGKMNKKERSYIEKIAMDKYNKWLDKNKEKLIETQAIEKLDVPVSDNTVSGLSEKEFLFLQKREWYKKNVPLKDAIKEAQNGINKDSKIIELNKEIITLYNSKRDMSQKDTESKYKAEKDIRIKTTSIKRRKKLISLMEESKNKKVGSFDFFNTKISN